MMHNISGKFLFVCAAVLTWYTPSHAAWQEATSDTLNPTACSYRLAVDSLNFDGEITYTEHAYPNRTSSVGPAASLDSKPWLMFHIDHQFLFALSNTGIATPGLMARITELNLTSGTQVSGLVLGIEPGSSDNNASEGAFEGTVQFYYYNSNGVRRSELFSINTEKVRVEENCETEGSGSDHGDSLDGLADQIAINANDITNNQKLVKKKLRRIIRLLRKK